MESKLLKNIIKSTNSIRKKYTAIKTGKIDKEILLEETFKPISKPLRELKEKTVDTINEQNEAKVKEEVKNETSQINHFSNSDDGEKFIQPHVQIHKQSSSNKNTTVVTPDKTILSKQSSILHCTPNRNVKESMNKSRELFSKNGPLASFYMKEYNNNSRNIDKTFGPKYNENLKTFEIGRHEIEFDENIIKVDGDEYPATYGLYELIFMKNPYEYDQTDLENYKNILLKSNIYRMNVNDEHSRIKGNSGEKYKNIISKLIQGKKGGGIMLLNNHKSNYIYWDNPNELVQRLRVLIASQQAGHSNHNNEIISIIEELREANIII